MKPSPLKDKFMFTQEIYTDRESMNFTITYPIFRYVDIELAVQWLKTKRYIIPKDKSPNQIFVVEWDDIIEAFEDVVK